MDAERIDRIEQLFRRRYNRKKQVNILISALIVGLGASSLLYIWTHDGEGALTLRWMTVDGTIFTTAIALCYVAVSAFELARYTELTSRLVYCMRLASAVAEALITVVVLVSQLPCFPQHMHIFRFDMFNMHLLIPLLTVASFVINDSPIGKLKAKQLLHGVWFVTLYAATLLTLILTGALPEALIPYPFMDVAHMPAPAIGASLIFIYGLSFALSWLLSRWNRRLSWLWFRGVARASGSE